MTHQISDAELDILDAYLSVATEGPWVDLGPVEHNESCECNSHAFGRLRQHRGSAEEFEVGEAIAEDADLIVAMRNLVPKLVAEVRALRARGPAKAARGRAEHLNPPTQTQMPAGTISAAEWVQRTLAAQVRDLAAQTEMRMLQAIFRGESLHCDSCGIVVARPMNSEAYPLPTPNSMAISVSAEAVVPFAIIGEKLYCERCARS